MIRRIRTQPARRAGPRRREEAGPHPRRRRLAAPTAATSAPGPPAAAVGYDYVHSAVDDHSRLAYSEDPPDENARHLRRRSGDRRRAFFADHGITVERRPHRQRHGLPQRRLPAALRRARRPALAASGPTGPRPTARSSASTAPCSTNGPTSGACRIRRRTAPTPSTPGSTATTITATTPPSAAHPSAASTTCRVTTPDPTSGAGSVAQRRIAHPELRPWPRRCPSARSVVVHARFVVTGRPYRRRP